MWVGFCTGSGSKSSRVFLLPGSEFCRKNVESSWVERRRVIPELLHCLAGLPAAPVVPGDFRSVCVAIDWDVPGGCSLS